MSKSLGATLVATDMWYYIEKKDKGQQQKKLILQNVSMAIQCGKVLAIMGPSGAGKTMLLNCLTLTRGPGKRYGSCTLNGEVFTNSLFQKYCSIVTQQDVQWPFLTCRQTLGLSADLSPSRQGVAKDARLKDLCEKSGMLDCMDTRVGNAFIPGLAFGQRRRLSLMVALLKNPLVIFLDEPTTNLDSASAAGIMKHLKVVATESNIIMVCTIHQPDKHVFDGFDRLMLMSDGRVAYFGEAKDSLAWFRSMQHECPRGVNPGDFLLDLLNKQFTDPLKVDELLAAWASKRKDSLIDLMDGPARGKSGLPSQDSSVGIVTQIATLVRRHAVLWLKDPSLYIGRMIMITFATFFFSLCYMKSRDRNQEQALNRLWLMVWCVGVPGNLAVVATFALNLEFATVKFEVLAGMYKLFVYIFAQALIQVPCMVLEGICAVTLSGYAMGGWNGSTYVQTVLMYALAFLSYETVAQTCSVGKSHPLLGMLDFLNYWFGSFLFCGLLIRANNVIWPFRIMVYIAPLWYHIQSVAYLDMDGTFYEGAREVKTSLGYDCPSNSGSGCFGYKGSQVLKSLHTNFEVVEEDANVGFNIIVIAIICIVFKLQFVALAYYRCRSVKPPAEVPKNLLEELQKQSDEQQAQTKKAGEEAAMTQSNSRLMSVRGQAQELPKHKGKSDVIFSVENAWYVTKKPCGGDFKLKLLQGATFSVKSGQILAIMGPSGAGKSLLLNTISLVKGGSPFRFGTVKLNSTAFTASAFTKYGNQILQMDNHWPFMTPREQLLMAANMYSGRPANEKIQKVDELIEKMGLSNCKNTRIGNQFVPGCSGGQRRRVSIAMALISDPRIVFLDEPTAGLDSAAAWNIITRVKEIALEQDVAVMTTLSQPSIEIYDLIDQLVLLADGQVAYSGVCDEAVNYFSSIGHAPPEDDNPAEFLVSFLNRGFAKDANTVDNILASWQQNASQWITRPDETTQGQPLPEVPAGANCFARSLIVLKRQGVLVLRDPTLYTGRIIMNMCAVAFFGIIYIKSRDTTQTQAINRVFLNMWAMGVPTNLIVGAVFAYGIETVQVVGENRTGMYGMLEYLIAQTLLQVPMMFILGMSGMIMGFIVGDWAFDNFVQYWVVYTLCYLACESAAQSLAVRPMHMLLNMMDYANFWFGAFLFCGMLLPEEDVFWPLRLMCFIMPFKYGLRSDVYLVIRPQIFEGYAEDANGQPACPGIHPSSCFGRTGCQVLDSMNKLFDGLSCKDTPPMDVVYLLIIIASFKFLFVVTLFGRSSGMKPCKPAPNTLKRDELTFKKEDPPKTVKTEDVTLEEI